METLYRLALAFIFASTTGCALTRPIVPFATQLGDPPVVVGAAAVATADDLHERAAHAEEVFLGWGIDIAGATTRWRECTSETACSVRVVEAPSAEVVAVSVVGRASPLGADGVFGDETEVLRITVHHRL